MLKRMMVSQSKGKLRERERDVHEIGFGEQRVKSF